MISAVGHETDTTLADFAADLRAPTPTAAAELAVPVREELANQLAELALRKRRAVIRPLSLGRERLEARAQRLPKPEALLSPFAQQLDDLGERLRRALRDRAGIERDRLQNIAKGLSLPLLRNRLERARDRLEAQRLFPVLIERRIAEGRERVGVLWRMAEQLSPKEVLKRGYAIVRGDDGRPVMTAGAAREQSALEIEFSDGRIRTGPRQTRSSRKESPPTPEQGKLL